MRNAAVGLRIYYGTAELFRGKPNTTGASMVGSIANGMIMIGWLGIFLMGMAG
ncbi:MAG: hypothetical protein ACLUTA_14175 [Blautia wexlerae]